jgi:hypothetical protein
MSNKQNPISVRNEDEEYRQVQKDLVKVLVLNGIFFALLLGLYFWNRATGAVDQFFASLLKF